MTFNVFLPSEDLCTKAGISSELIAKIKKVFESTNKTYTLFTEQDISSVFKNDSNPIGHIIFYDGILDQLPKPINQPVLAMVGGDLKDDSIFRLGFSTTVIGTSIASYLYTLFQSDSENTRLIIVSDSTTQQGKNFSKSISDTLIDYKISQEQLQILPLEEGSLKTIKTLSNELKTYVVIYGYGDIYLNTITELLNTENLERIILETNYLTYQEEILEKIKDAPKEKIICITGDYDRESKDNFVAFAQVARSICDDAISNGLDSNAFESFLQSLRFYETKTFGTLYFRDDGELFMPLFIYDGSLETRAPLEQKLPHYHRLLPNEHVAEQLSKIAQLIESFDAQKISRSLSPTNELTKLLNGCAQTIKTTYGDKNILQINFISKHPQTLTKFFQIDTFDSDTSNSSSTKRDEYSHSAFIDLIDFMPQERPIQLNLNTPDLEDNDTFRVFIKPKNDCHDLKILKLFSWLKDKGADDPENLTKNIEAIILAKCESVASQTYTDYQKNKTQQNDKKANFYSYTRKNQLFGFVLPYSTNEDFVKRLLSVDFLANKKNFPDANFYYFIPETKHNKEKSSGILMLTKEKLTLFDLQILSNIVSRIFVTIHTALTLLDLKKAHIRSAIGSIMSRNGSHNIGSHVLAALTHNVGTMPDDRILYQYIQHRMDYIAQVCTEHPTWTQPTMFVGDIMKNFFAQRHLLDYISRSEGLSSYHFQDSNMSEEERSKQQGKIKLFIRRYKNQNEAQSKQHPNYSESKIAGTTVRAQHIITLAYNQYYNFIDYCTGENSIDWEKDIQLAIPGGAVGCHAFYTIIENIIRNAAKHGWATREESNEEMQKKTTLPKNLEIYIDFEDKEDSAEVEFTIWDNISNVFAPWKKCFPYAITTINKAFKDILNCIRLPDTQTLNKIKGSMADAATKKPNPIPFPLPLHWALQLKLSEPFICETGALRHQDWGLAEMKISAGFLQQRTIEEIGGLTELKNKNDAIITPIAMPGVCYCPDNTNGRIQCNNDCKSKNKGSCPRDNKIYHLGYRFKVKKPKEILIALNPNDDHITSLNQDNSLLATLKKYGIYFAKQSKEISATTFTEINSNKQITKFDFEYVVLDSVDKNLFTLMSNGRDTNNASNFHFFPFRVLTRPCSKTNEDDKNNDINKYIPICDIQNELQNLITQANQVNTSNLKCKVYDAWIHHLYDRSPLPSNAEQTDNGGKVYPLQIYLNTVGETNESGRGLISDAEIWKYFFEHRFRALISEFLDKHANDTDVYPYVPTFIAMYFDKITSKDNLKEKFVIKNSLCCPDETYLTDLNLEQKVKEVFHQIKTGYLQEPIYSWRNLVHFYKEISLDLIYKLPYSLYQKFENYLGVAFKVTDGLLRKYEEKIATLPQGYATKGFDSKKEKTYKSLLKTVELTQEQDSSQIFYYRHGAAARGIYCEGLSGAQSYLNLLVKLQENGNDALLAKMAENALMRVLIADERMCDFFTAHQDCISNFSKMNLWVLDIKNTQGDNKHSWENANHTTVGSLSFNLNLMRDAIKQITSDSNNQTQSKQEQGKNATYLDNISEKFDIFILHQGLLDKWGYKSEEQVANFIKKMKKHISYVVITTGRGKPANIPDEARVIPFACIENFLFQRYPEKLLLVDTIMNILPYGGNHGQH